VASAGPSGFAPLRLPKPSPPASCGGHIIPRDGDTPSLTLLAVWSWVVPNFALTEFSEVRTLTLCSETLSALACIYILPGRSILPSLYNGARGFSHPALYRRGKKMSKTKPWGPLPAAAGTLAAVGLLLLLMLVVLYAQPAEANYPGTNGKIAYSGWDGNDWDIYTIKPDGGGRKNVTNNNTDDENPAYSPSGKKIAYSGQDGNDWDIYTINPDGGGRKNVTNNNTDDNQPSYSPSGKKIAYVYDPGTGDTEIYYIKPDGGGRKNVTNNNTNNLYPYWGCKGGCK
jgi:hypothetical protein